MSVIVEVEGLVREFQVRTAGGWLRRGRHVVRAVDEISFCLRPGETVGYIGANGAGKSTTIKIVTGILTPTAGRVRTCGLVPITHRRRLARHIGVVFGQRSQLWWDLPLGESLRILAAIHRLPSARYRDRRDELVERLDLGDFLDRPVRQLSLGQRMRGEVAAALLHSPELIVLDEPTVGLDVLSKERLRLFLLDELAAHGRTLLLTTHDMDDVERLCRRLLVVDRGRLVYDGDQAGLAARVGARRVLVVDLAEPCPPLDAVPGTTLLSTQGGLRQRLAFSPTRTTAASVLQAVSERATVRDLSIEEPDIEDVVRRLYQGSQP
ncbi:MAG TPA: ATP-binding cassette domain-containing protein [Kineosporiaceae bacterium]